MHGIHSLALPLPRPTFCKMYQTKAPASKLVYYLHSLVRFDWKQVMIAPCEMRRAHDHQSANVAIGRHVAHFRHTSRTEKAFALHVRVACTKTRWRRVGEAHRKTHHHQICSRIRTSSTSARYSSLGWRRDKLEEQILEVSLVHRHPKLAYSLHQREGTLDHRLTHHPFYHTCLDISSSQPPRRPRRFEFYSSHKRRVYREYYPDRRSSASQR